MYVWGMEDSNEYALAQKGIQSLYNFFKEYGIPMTLTEVGINEEYFDKMAEDAVKYGGLAGAY